MLQLDEENGKLENLVVAAQKLLNNHGREVSEFCLIWAFWMLEQRYYNLVLHSLDMDCILDRRVDIIKKVSMMMVTTRKSHTANWCRFVKANSEAE